MVRLTITQKIYEAIEECKNWPGCLDEISLLSEPALGEAAVGGPISHGQVIGISKSLMSRLGQTQSQDPRKHSLDALLKGSRIYVEPPQQKPEPTSQYKALMARLRREEEALAYERMINPPLPMETFQQRFPNAAGSKLFGNVEVNEDDEVTYADLDRQMALIINVIVSIVACSVALWLASRHWSTPRRLGLSMGGSGLVAVAEIVVYMGYLRRVTKAKEKTKKQREVKEIINTWEIGTRKNGSKSETSLALVEDLREENGLRKRQIRPS